MRRIVLGLMLLLCLVATGCTSGDALFGLFGSYHSDGYSRGDSQDSYERNLHSVRDTSP
jgi:hypothetical protein